MAALGMDGAPMDFDREREREIAIRAKPSLLCVLVKLRKQYIEEESNYAIAETLYNAVAKKVATADKRKRELPGSITKDSGERQSTGFAIATNGIKLRILTCAHTLADVYSQGKHNQLTIEQINGIFRFEVHCVHHEQWVRTLVSNKPISERDRWSIPATVVAIDTQLDLMVLEVFAEELVHDVPDGIQMACENNHPVIPLSNANPMKMQKLVMAGWPPQRPGASAAGQVSECDWNYDSVSGLNTKGYTMRLLEVHGLASDSGFSGAPVLNGLCQCAGVYHGVLNLSMGYSISLEDVNAFLEAHGMLNWVA